MDEKKGIRLKKIAFKMLLTIIICVATNLVLGLLYNIKIIQDLLTSVVVGPINRYVSIPLGGFLWFLSYVIIILTVWNGSEISEKPFKKRVMFAIFVLLLFVGYVLLSMLITTPLGSPIF